MMHRPLTSIARLRFIRTIIFMTTNRNSENRDILDNASQEYSRVKSGYNIQALSDSSVRQDLMLKNLYRQQLDDLMREKAQQKKKEREIETQEKQIYNQRLNYGKEAERLKDLSYKNYYQMLLNNQSKLNQNYQGYSTERDNLKDHLIQKGIEEERIRSQRQWQVEQARLQNEKRNYRQELDRQVNEKQMKTYHERQEKTKLQEQYKKISFTPSEVAKLQRDRKMMEMSKYREDLDRTSPNKGEKTRIMTGTNIVGKGSNDFNIYNHSYHNPMTNPLPYNIQNPYLLREMMRKQQFLKPNMSSSSGTHLNP